MNKAKLSTLLVLLLISTACTTPAPLSPISQNTFSRTASTQKGTRSLTAALGQTFNPDTSALSLSMQFAPIDNFTIGPDIQLGMDKDIFLVAPTINIKNTFTPPLDFLNNSLAYIDAGLGFVYMDQDTGNATDDDDTAILITMGGGLEFKLQEDVTLFTALKLNYVPDKVLGEECWITWEMIGLKFYF